MTSPALSTKRWLKPLAAVAAGAALWLSAPSAGAQEIQLTGPLAGAPAVRKLRLHRQGRFELAPTVGFTLLDEYRRTIFVGAQLQYNIADWLSVGLYGAYGVGSLTTDLTEQIDSQSPRNSRTAPNINHAADGSARSFPDQTSKLTYFAAPQLHFSPLRGKLAVFEKLFVDTDAYLHAGVAFVGVDERGDCGGTKVACSNPDTFKLESRTAIAPTFGLGLSFYTSSLINFRLEYRAFPFAWNRAGFDSRGGGNDGKFPDNKITSDDRTFKFNQMVSLSIGFVFPTKPKLSE